MDLLKMFLQDTYFLTLVIFHGLLGLHNFHPDSYPWENGEHFFDIILKKVIVVEKIALFRCYFCSFFIPLTVE
jgi:hypothetical protein